MTDNFDMAGMPHFQKRSHIALSLGSRDENMFQVGRCFENVIQLIFKILPIRTVHFDGPDPVLALGGCLFKIVAQPGFLFYKVAALLVFSSICTSRTEQGSDWP